MTQDELAAAITEAAQSIHRPHSLQESLDAIVQTVALALPDLGHAGISEIHRDGRVETVAGTDDLVRDLDAVQYELGEGPCLDSMVEQPLVLVEHLRHEQRWPGFIARAVQAGVRSQMAVRLYSDGETLGALNLYSTSTDTIDEDAVQLAELFATHAALALGRARTEDQLNQAIASRKVIGQAIGIVMERYQVTEDRAFQFLIRASQTSNIKLRSIAHEVVAATNDQYGATTRDS